MYRFVSLSHFSRSHSLFHALACVCLCLCVCLFCGVLILFSHGSTVYQQRTLSGEQCLYRDGPTIQQAMMIMLGILLHFYVHGNAEELNLLFLTKSFQCRYNAFCIFSIVQKLYWHDSRCTPCILQHVAYVSVV